mmetsp:Transcript_27535/g.58167  ORF Transcript_27535/g.58167 Transcript_27535/m.58167 type:complete len:647 (-) Transcript_27535:36-1976(-)
MIPSIVVASRARCAVAVARVGLPSRPSLPSLPSQSYAYPIGGQHHHCRYFTSDTNENLHDGIDNRRSASSTKYPSPKQANPKRSAKNSPQESDSYSYGINNFTKMLQYQNFPNKSPQKSRTNKYQYQRKQNQRSERTRYGPRHEQTSSSVPMGTSKTSHDNSEIEGERYEHDRRPRQRHQRRNGRPSLRRHQNERATRRHPNTSIHHLEPTIATSDWVMITNIPLLSELSDLCLSLNRILDYEMQKGIIDLDALGDLEKGSVGDDVDDATRTALRGIDALDSLYSTQQIEDENIPLWTPSSLHQSQPLNEKCPLILEARLYLSYSARPIGWFLRLPNRSVVHAVLNHVRRAKEYDGERKLGLKHQDDIIKRERREWRDELGKGLWIEPETEEEKELMWGGDELGEDEERDEFSEGTAFFDGEADGAIQEASGVKEQVGTVEDYLQKYLETNPFPMQSTEPHDNTLKSPYQLLKSGSTTLNIQEFSPHQSEDDAPTSWDQHSFCLSPLLNLSDSIVRVETPVLRTNEDEIRFFFRNYDLESMMPLSEEDATTASTTINTLPHHFTRFPGSLGWNMQSGKNVDCLVKGIHAKYGKGKQQEKNTPRRSNRHTFLLRFASPAAARMAVRDKEGAEFHRERLSVMQYPRQL